MLQNSKKIMLPSIKDLGCQDAKTTQKLMKHLSSGISSATDPNCLQDTLKLYINDNKAEHNR